MESRNQEQREPKTPEPRKAEPKRRFRIEKLEERIAPSGGRRSCLLNDGVWVRGHCSYRGGAA